MSAELFQVAQQTAGLPLLGTALLLGLRHGVDWDHIAAITDIANTTASADLAETASTRGPAGRRLSLGRVEMRAIGLSLLYALGHAAVVVVLGLAALSSAALLPDWVDPLMERVVGVTLLILGVWVFYSLSRYLRGEQDFRLQSRWMLVFAGVRHGIGWLRARFGRGEHHQHFRVDQYGPRAAFGVGMLHGIGAETGSQVLIIAAIGGAASQGLGAVMMIAFVVGLVISNTLIATLAATGFISSTRVKPLYVAFGALTGVFSLLVGGLFTLGMGDELPDLQQLFEAAGAEPDA